MLLVPILKAIEAKLKGHPALLKLKYVQVAPKTGVAHPFICLPYTSSSTKYPYLNGMVAPHAINDRMNLHTFNVPILVAVSKHDKEDALVILDPIQQAVFTQLNAERTFGGLLARSSTSRQFADAFAEIGDDYIGVVFVLWCEAFEAEVPSIYDSWIETEDMTVTTVL